MTQNMINLDEPFLLLLIGTSGSGKSSFTKRHFKDTEVISSDSYRRIVSDRDTEYDEHTTKDIRILTMEILSMRLQRKLSVVMDATNTDPVIRKEYLKIAKKHNIPCYAIVFLLPLEECLRRNAIRTYRTVKEEHIRAQYKQVEDSLEKIGSEGFTATLLFHSQEEVNNCIVKRPEHIVDNSVQYDFIGDVHSSLANLISILQSLGYIIIHDATEDKFYLSHPLGRKPVFLPEVVGDPKVNPKINKLVTSLVASGKANLLH